MERLSGLHQETFCARIERVFVVWPRRGLKPLRPEGTRLLDLVDCDLMLILVAHGRFPKKNLWIQCWDFNLKIDSVQNGP